MILPGPGDVAAAAARIRPHVRRTPVLDVELAGRTLTLKLELLQHTGSFKPRGAFNRLLSLPERPPAVVAASGGNHGLAVAYAAHRLGIPAEVFVPESTPEVKRRRIGALGVTLHVGGATYDDALAASRARAAETGAVEIHAYDDPAVVAGQGTVFSELGPLDTVLVAVGGGGLIAGAAAWFGDRVRLVAVEPESAPTFAAARAAGAPVDVDVGGVAADSLGARRVGSDRLRPPRGDGLVGPRRATPRSSSAQRWLWDETRIVAEPGGATALAAVLSGRYPLEPGETGRRRRLRRPTPARPAGVTGPGQRPRLSARTGSEGERRRAAPSVIAHRSGATSIHRPAGNPREPCPAPGDAGNVGEEPAAPGAQRASRRPARSKLPKSRARASMGSRSSPSSDHVTERVLRAVRSRRCRRWRSSRGDSPGAGRKTGRWPGTRRPCPHRTAGV